MEQKLNRVKTGFVKCIVFLVIILSYILSSCGGREPIPVGFSAGLTGRNAALGVDGRDGALLAVEKINAEGGVRGRPIELLIRDDMATPEGALSADMSLVREGVVAIIGHMTSETMISAWTQMKDAGVVYVSPTVSTPQLQGMDDNFFRLIPVNSFQAKNIARYAIEELELKRVVVFYDEDNIAFTGTYRDGFVDEWKTLGGEIVAEYRFSSAAVPDFKPMLMDAQPDEPDGILTVASAVDTALIAQQAHLLGIDIQFLTSNWALTEDLIQSGGQAVEGILSVVTHNENNRSPAYLDFSTRFEERFGRQPTFAAGYGYEAVLVLAAALEKTDGTSDGLASALLQTNNFPGVHGRISFDAYGDVIRSLYLITVQDGQFLTLSTLDAETK